MLEPFHYHQDILCAEDVPLPKLAKAVQTPFYCYSMAALRYRYLQFDKAFADRNALVCFAVKANSNPHLLKVLASLGAGADIVSLGELHQALRAGIPAQKIVFSGVGKSRPELEHALKAGVLQINIESGAELRLLSQVANELGKVAEIAVRVNPDVDAATHAKITTGKSDNKFGVRWEDALALYHEAGNLPGVIPVGVAVHIGSQLTQLEPFRNAFTKVAGLVEELRRNGYNIKRLDLGGGLGIDYTGENVPAIADYAAMVKDVTDRLKCQLIFEPGRYIIGETGILVAKVLYVKESGSKLFAIIDAAMNDFMRPALYDARHRITPVRKPVTGGTLHHYDVVGPVCETTDIFGSVDLPKLESGDYLALMTTGAYGSVLASSYNMRLAAPELLVHQQRYAIIKRRPSYEELNALYPAPQWHSS